MSSWGDMTGKGLAVTPGVPSCQGTMEHYYFGSGSGAAAPILRHPPGPSRNRQFNRGKFGC
eukprot:13819239-Alexandrium_andersonii.AAC.1